MTKTDPVVQEIHDWLKRQALLYNDLAAMQQDIFLVDEIKDDPTLMLEVHKAVLEFYHGAGEMQDALSDVLKRLE